MTAPSTVVIGAGFAGLSTAVHLAQSGFKDILVLEEDTELGGHASGRNAGMIRQTVSDPFIARLAVEGRRALSRAHTLEWKTLKFLPTGSLLIAKGDATGELDKIQKVLAGEGVATRRFSKKQAGRMVSLIDGGDFEEALYCPSDALVDIGGLLQGFLGMMRRHRIRLFLGHGLRSIRKEKGLFVISAGRRTFTAEILVNAAGAWAGLLSQKAKAARVPLAAYRRHLYISRPSVKVRAHWPFVWDLTHNFYFRPIEGKRLLLSPCDKALFRLKLGSAEGRTETLDPRRQKDLMKKLGSFSDHFGFLILERKKAGLRTLAPDGRFVIGEDPKVPGFFWVAGLGGHGVTTSFSVGRFAADLILKKRVDPALARAFSPGRF
ncbi:MAG: FAD-binding oxidoreductase [Candidatus Omnitrophica bacterium]|nr:FAD-binding oxidoreductase [Candidatus Omnitrophota bacterium]